MNTRKSTKLSLFEKEPPIFTSKESQGFQGSFPPTVEDIILQFYGYHSYLQESSKRKSSISDAVKLVVEDLIVWWKRTDIRLVSPQQLQAKMIGLINYYKLRVRYMSKTTEAELEKQKVFQEEKDNTFWGVDPKHEKMLQDAQSHDKQDQRDIEDWLYLEGVRGKNRSATIGCFDKKLDKRRKRSLDQETLQARREKSSACTSQNVQQNDISAIAAEEESDDSGKSLYTSPVPRKRKKKIPGITEEVYLLAEKDKLSQRTLVQIAAAFHRSKSVDLNDYNLSVMTSLRARKCLRSEKAAEITHYQLHENSSNMYALHWDGKIIKSLNHVGKDIERVAVILTGTNGKEVLLSIVGIDGESTAENETNHIIQVLRKYDIRSENIVALVFDTTSLNTGCRQGIVVRLEEEFERSLLQLPCRHHILELVGGASCSFVYGPTSGPKEEVFKKLTDNFKNLDLKNYSSIELSRQQKALTVQVKDAVSFLQEWLKNSTKDKLRHDYLELAELSLLFLGGKMPQGMSNTTIKAPGALHHARWMSKCLYTLKIALFRHQLKDLYTSEQLEDILNLAIFMSIFYTKPWLTCTSASNAPFNDLTLIKKLLKVESSIQQNPKAWPVKFLCLVSLARQKLEKHLHYLSERLVSFAIFSDHVSASDKKQMVTALFKHQRPVMNKSQELPQSHDFKGKFLKDFIGNDSWTMFILLRISSNFLKLPVSQWATCGSYLHGKEILSNLPIVNDAAERALGLATEVNTKTAPKSEDQLQDRYKIVKAVREKLSSLATSTEIVTKKALNAVDYKWGEV